MKLLIMLFSMHIYIVYLRNIFINSYIQFCVKKLFWIEVLLKLWSVRLRLTEVALPQQLFP
jgi:hypothetical protein